MIVEISEGLSIDTQFVQAVRKIDEATCVVDMGTNIHTVDFSYDTFLSIWKSNVSQENKELNVLQDMNKKIGELPIFAG